MWPSQISGEDIVGVNQNNSSPDSIISNSSNLNEMTVNSNRSSTLQLQEASNVHQESLPISLPTQVSSSSSTLLAPLSSSSSSFFSAASSLSSSTSFNSAHLPTASFSSSASFYPSLTASHDQAPFTSSSPPPLQPSLSSPPSHSHSLSDRGGFLALRRMRERRGRPIAFSSELFSPIPESENLPPSSLAASRSFGSRFPEEAPGTAQGSREAGAFRRMLRSFSLSSRGRSSSQNQDNAEGTSPVRERGLRGTLGRMLRQAIRRLRISRGAQSSRYSETVQDAQGEGENHHEHGQGGSEEEDGEGDMEGEWAGEGEVWVDMFNSRGGIHNSHNFESSRGRLATLGGTGGEGGGGEREDADAYGRTRPSLRMNFRRDHSGNAQAPLPSWPSDELFASLQRRSAARFSNSSEEDSAAATSPGLHNRFRFRPRSRPNETEEVDSYWWAGAESEDDMGVIEAAMQAILMDGIAGALQSSGSRRVSPYSFLFGDEEAWTYEQLLELDRNNVRRGLKAQEVWDLNRHKMGAGEDKVDCQICLSEAVVGDLLTTLPCAHCYHDACITPWFKTHRTCPICRFEISA